MEVMDYNNAQLEEQQVTGEHNNIENESNAQDPNNEVQAKNVKVDPIDTDSDISDTDSEQICPICMEQWTSSGKHRLCCLRCGHLFGHNCILRWLQESCTSANRRCPQCNKKAMVKHIRMLYAKKLTSIDTSELDKLKNELNNATEERNRAQMELSRCNIRQKLYEQQLTCMKSRIAELESQQSERDSYSNQNSSKPCTKKFHLERSIDICKDGGCRVLAYNPWYKVLIASQKSTNMLFAGYGIRKVDPDKFQSQQFIFLHTQAIRDITFHSTQQTLLLSVGFDKCAKLMDIQNNIIVHTYQTQHSLWSCCWSGDNPNIFLVGAQNGVISQFDIRQTSSAVDTLNGLGDRSPVVSLATAPPNPGSGISRGGFIACHLNTCYVYEVKEASYLPKQVFLEGPFVSVCYDEKNNHVLISSRPNVRQAHARHTVCTIEKDHEETIMCNVVHTFHAGNSQQLLSRPCHVYAEDDTLIAAHQESTSSISLWSMTSGKQLHSLPVSDPVMDLCSFVVNNDLFLATLSAKKLRLYNYGQLR